ncbi:MAG: MFS transporter, partial [Bacteroidota bacterium]
MIRAWTFYDWANSVYSLVIVSSIFPVYYQAVTTGTDGSDQVDFFGFRVANSVLMSFAISFSYVLVTPMLPVLSGIADYSGNKKRFMRFFAWLGGLSCCGLYLFEGPNLEWGICCLIMASVGYSGSVVFYDAYLPEIVTPDMTDRVSARGYTMGYFGSIILMVSGLIMMTYSDALGFPSQLD